MRTKICVVCQIDKAEDGFYQSNNSRASDKRSIICIQCSAMLPEREKVRIQTAHWRKNNPARSRAIQQGNHFLRTYGITLEEYEMRSQQQQHLCAICSQPSITKHQSGAPRLLAIDHDHITGQVRGLLCSSCKHGLGAFKDDINLLTKAIDYLTAKPHDD